MNQFVQTVNYNAETMNVLIKPFSVMENLIVEIAQMKLPVLSMKIQMQLQNAIQQSAYFLIASAQQMEPKYQAN